MFILLCWCLAEKTFNSLLGIISMFPLNNTQIAPRELYLSIPFWGLFLCFVMTILVIRLVKVRNFQFPSGDYFYVSCDIKNTANSVKENFQFPSGDYFYVSRLRSWRILSMIVSFNSLLGIISMFLTILILFIKVTILTFQFPSGDYFYVSRTKQKRNIGN